MLSSLRNVFGLSLMAWVGSFSLSAQEAPLNTIDAVLAAFMNANGGKENVDSIVSVRATGRIIRDDGSDFELIVMRKAPNKKRVTTIMENVVVSRGFDGETSWRYMKVNDVREVREKVEMLEGEEKVRFERDVFLLDMLFYPEGPGIHHELTGVEYVGRAPCYVVKSKVGGNRRTSYVDSRTFRIPKVIEHSTDENGEEVNFEQILQDYVKVHGVWIAREIIRKGDEAVTARFDEVRINDGIFNTIFSVPEID